VCGSITPATRLFAGPLPAWRNLAGRFTTSLPPTPDVSACSNPTKTFGSSRGAATEASGSAIESSPEIRDRGDQCHDTVRPWPLAAWPGCATSGVGLRIGIEGSAITIATSGQTSALVGAVFPAPGVAKADQPLGDPYAEPAFADGLPSARGRGCGAGSSAMPSPTRLAAPRFDDPEGSEGKRHPCSCGGFTTAFAFGGASARTGKRAVLPPARLMRAPRRV
jgi:hypothetical protein